MNLASLCQYKAPIVFGTISDSILRGAELRDTDGKALLMSMSRQFVMSNMYQRTRTGMSYVHNQTALQLLHHLRPCQEISLDQNETIDDNVTCFSLIASQRQDTYPKTLHDCSGDVCKYLQTLAFGYTFTEPSHVDSFLSGNIVPNVVHYIWFGRLQMSFMFYLSVLSFIYTQNVDQVYIHCDQAPVGNYWSNLEARNGNVIRIVYRSNPSVVFNQTISVIQHAADIAKADIAYKYGGIISDPDVIIVQKLKADWFKQETVVGLDIGATLPFPDTLNVGLLLCRPQAAFARQWMESMKEFNDSSWLWNSGRKTYKLVERDPKLALIEPRLQVICYNFKCYPTWLPQELYKNLSTSSDTLEHSLRNWTTQAYAFHFTFPEPFFNERYLQGQSGLVGQIGRHVMKAAGLAVT